MKVFRRQKEGKPETFGEITEHIQNTITAPHWGDEEARRRQEAIRDVYSGRPGAKEHLVGVIAETLAAEELSLDGHPTDLLARDIYKMVWGLGILEDIYHDPDMDEIRVNGPGPHGVWVVRRGRNERAPVHFESEDQIRTIVRRLFLHDQAVGLDQSNPLAESMRKDGTRVTATCPPVTEHWSFVLRKHDTFEMTPENLCARGTLNMPLWEMLACFARHGVNILIAGGMNSGKSHLLRRLVRETDPNRRIVVIETDRELNLRRHYPERDIVEFEEHKNTGASMERIFIHSLRYSGDMLIVGEFRGHGEAREAINAASRGCDGSMATGHFSSPEAAVEGTAKMVIQEGANIPLHIAKTMVAGAFNVIVQMVNNPTRGIKKIVRVTEIWPSGEMVEFSDLAVWAPGAEDYFAGGWVFPNPLSEGLLAKMRRHGLTLAAAREMGWGQS
ncbi:MAG: CpaF family protein [Desulforudis sp.]|nr:MAG: CpaF family protein [Desulforudis sp.]